MDKLGLCHYISDKYQLRRSLIILGEAFAGLGTILAWYFHTVPQSKWMAGYVIIVGLSIIEIFWSMSNIGWTAFISDVYRPDERNSVQGKLVSVGGIGRIIGLLLGGLLYDGFEAKYPGWGFHEGALFFIAAAAMFISIIPMLFLPEGGIKQNQKNLNSSRETEEPEFSMKILIIFLIAIGFITFGINSSFVIKSQFLVLKSGFNLSNQSLSYVINTESAAMMLIGLFVGILGKKLGNGKIFY